MREKIIRKVRDNQKLSGKENAWLNKMLMSPKVLCRILLDVLGVKEENISDRKN